MSKLTNTLLDKPMEVNFGIIAFSIDRSKEDYPIRVEHFCGYENKPGYGDYASLFSELKTDPEFGLTERMGVDVFLAPATDHIVEMYRPAIDKAENIDG